MQNTSRTRPRQTHRRAGFAPIELVMILPMLVTLLLAILTVGSVGLRHTEVVIEARQDAWEHRHELSDASLGVADAQELGRVLRPDADHMADSGLHTGEAEREHRSFLPGMLDELTSPSRDEVMLGGTWDHRVIRFEEEEDHDPLTLGHRTEAFGVNRNAREAFGLLAGMPGGISGGLGALQSALGMIAPASQANASAASNLRRQLNDVNRQLRQARREDPPDNDRIRRLEDDRDRLEGQLDTVQRAQGALPAGGP